ncbi:MAG: hypothetical protein ACRCW2_00185 [Cellulosilyticaceae bacterium]
MAYLYHGSLVAGIATLQVRSYVRDYPGEKVVYLSGSRAYALFYIWDAVHNQRTGKYVTCSLKEGIVHYYEQFPNQVEAFYDGVSGYMYAVRRDNNFISTSEYDMWLSKKDVQIEQAVFIPNVYDEIKRYEEEGNIKIIRFNRLSEQEKKQCSERMMFHIKKNNLLEMPHSEESQFVRYYFSDAWECAKASAELV